MGFETNDIITVEELMELLNIGKNTADSCRILKSISIPNGVTSIGDFTFSYCYKLASITITDSVTSIGNSAFKYCYSLSNISIRDGVTNIGESAFENCSSLSSIIIPVNVKSIGYEAFYECSGLESIKIENPDCDIYNSKYTIPETATIYGYENSTAQAYAEKYGKWFVSLGEKKPVTTTVTTEPETKGDANGDGEINVADIVLIQKCLVRIEVEVDVAVLDINEDDEM